MAFGKRKSDENHDDPDPGGPGESDGVDESEGPFDVEEFDDPSVVTLGRHDLGSVLIPENDAAELAVEVNQQGVPTMVWMVTPNGRYNITAYAAPKTGGLWREVVTEIAESLRSSGSVTVSGVVPMAQVPQG